MRDYYAMPYGDYFIWGATAGMLVSLHPIPVQMSCLRLYCVRFGGTLEITLYRLEP